MADKYKKLGIMGGTFDPIHIGHLIIAQQAYENFNLEKIIFIPAGIPPHKNSLTNSRHRLEMVKLAIEDNPAFTLSDWELKQEKKSYTVDTFKYLEKQNIAEEIYFIIGADSLYDMLNWKEPEYLLNRANFIVAARTGYSLEKIFKDQRYHDYEDKIFFLDNFKIEVSSSVIRKNVRQDKSVRYVLQNNVIEYIEKTGLYKGD